MLIHPPCGHKRQDKPVFFVVITDVSHFTFSLETSFHNERAGIFLKLQVEIAAVVFKNQYSRKVRPATPVLEIDVGAVRP